MQRHPEMTLRNLNDYSPAQIISETIARLMEQGRGSINPDTGRCVYRSPDGTKCAVGLLMSDEDYRESFDQRQGISASDAVATVEIPMGCSRISLLDELQSVHDRAAKSTADMSFADKLRESARWNMAGDGEWLTAALAAIDAAEANAAGQQEMPA